MTGASEVTPMADTDAPSRSTATRERLLSAAVTAFATRGFHGTTTRDIAAAAGMSPAAVYVHYPSKEELLYQLSRRGHRMIIDLIDSVDDHAASPAVRLRTVIHAFARHHASQHTSARVVNYELEALSPEHRLDIGIARRTITRRVRAIVDAGVADGSFDTAQPRLATTALLSGGIDVARWYRDGGDITPERIADFYATLALRMVGAVETEPEPSP